MRRKHLTMIQLKFNKPVLLLICIGAIIVCYVSIMALLAVECDPAIVITDGFSEIPKNLLTSRNIYFLETHNSTDHMLTTRAACSIESAALMNPDANIYVLFLSPTKYTRLKNWPQFQGILNYKNVHLKYFNTEDFIKDTVIEEWMAKGLLTSSWYTVAHTADVLRYALLYKYSGVYLDLDVIVRKSLDEIKLENFACFQDDREIVNNAIMKISDDDGRQLGRMLLNEVISHYDGYDWSMNGPKLLTRVLKSYCDVTDFLTTTKCENFTILPQERCYPIPWQNWGDYFSEDDSEKAINSLKHAYFVHFWNRKSEGTMLEKSSRAAFNQLAAEFCPHVYATNVLI